MGQVNVNPGNDTRSSSSSGLSATLIVALIVLIALLVLAYFVFWPMLSAQPQSPQVNVNVRSSSLFDAVAGLVA